MVREQPRHSNRQKGIKTCLDSHKFSLTILDSLLITRYLFKTSDLLFFFGLFYWSRVDLYVVLIFAIQQWFSFTHISILFHILFHYGLSQNIEYSSLGYYRRTLLFAKLIPLLPCPTPHLPWQPPVYSLVLILFVSCCAILGHSVIHDSLWYHGW